MFQDFQAKVAPGKKYLLDAGCIEFLGGWFCAPPSTGRGAVNQPWTIVDFYDYLSLLPDTRGPAYPQRVSLPVSESSRRKIVNVQSRLLRATFMSSPACSIVIRVFAFSPALPDSPSLFPPLALSLSLFLSISPVGVFQADISWQMPARGIGKRSEEWRVMSSLMGVEARRIFLLEKGEGVSELEITPCGWLMGLNIYDFRGYLETSVRNIFVKWREIHFWFYGLHSQSATHDPIQTDVIKLIFRRRFL